MSLPLDQKGQIVIPPLDTNAYSYSPFGTLDTPRTLNTPTAPWPEDFSIGSQEIAFMDKQHFPPRPPTRRGKQSKDD